VVIGKVARAFKTHKKTIILVLKRVFVSMLAVATLFFVAVFTISGAMKHSVKDRIISVESAIDMTDIDCILVLGAGLRKDGTPSDMLRDRLDRGIEVYTNQNTKLLFSGDHSREDYNEVGAMKTYTLGKNINSEDIFLDHAGFSTYESIYRALEIFEVEKIIIITQEYHMYRALYIAKQIGIEAYGVTADQNTYSGQLYRDTREVLARFKDFFFVLLERTPPFLGEKIPLSGDGNITDNGF
jgi:vancomycin permeability regulator SanA